MTQKLYLPHLKLEGQGVWLLPKTAILSLSEKSLSFIQDGAAAAWQLRMETMLSVLAHQRTEG